MLYSQFKSNIYFWHDSIGDIWVKGIVRDQKPLGMKRFVIDVTVKIAQAYLLPNRQTSKQANNLKHCKSIL